MSAADIPGGAAGRDLFGLAPDEFTAARNALAKQLRSAGEKAEAALVAKLRRPPTTAWALNKVARERPELIDAVADAGAALRAATERALAGDASALRTAHADERRAVDAATTAAAGILAGSAQGAGAGPRQRMASTLRAAMVDPGVADALGEGVLDDDRDASGFGLDAFSPAAAGTATRRRESPPAKQTLGKEPAVKAESEAEAGDAGDEVAARRDDAGDEVAARRDDAGDEVAARRDDAGDEVAARRDDAGDEVAARRDAKHAAERAATAKAAEAEAAQQQATRLAEMADEAEREAQVARAAAESSRGEAEAAATRAAEIEAAADTASTDAAAARSAADDAATRAEALAKATDPT